MSRAFAVVCALIACLWIVTTATAAPVQDTVGDELRALRSQAGLPALDPLPEAEAVLAGVHTTAQTTLAESGIPLAPAAAPTGTAATDTIETDCPFCEWVTPAGAAGPVRYDEQGYAIPESARPLVDVWAEAGGEGELHVVPWFTTLSMRENLVRVSMSARVLLDPRADAARVSEPLDDQPGVVLIAVRVRPERPFTPAVVLVPGDATPQDVALAALIAPGTTPTLLDRRGGASLARSGTLRRALVGQADGGGHFLRLALTGFVDGGVAPVRLGETLTLHTDAGEATMRVVFATGGATRLSGFSASQRRIVRRTLVQAPPRVRRILRELGPRLVIRLDPDRDGFSRASQLPYGRVRIDMEPGHISLVPISRMVLLHEVGHVVDFTYLGADGRRAYTRALRGCVAYTVAGRRSCVPANEWFADEFGRYGTRHPDGRTGYNTPPRFGPSGFGTFLARYAPAPLLYDAS